MIPVRTIARLLSQQENELRQHLIDGTMMLACLTMIVLSLASISMVIEIHAMRADEISTLSDLRIGMFSRADSLLWKADTLLTIASATNKSLGTGLTQVRVQVKESNDASHEAITEVKNATVSATKAVEKSIKETNETVQAVADKPPPVVEVKTDKATIIAPQPEIKVVHDPPKQTETVPEPAEEAQPKKKHRPFHWLHYLKFW